MDFYAPVSKEVKATSKKPIAPPETPTVKQMRQKNRRVKAEHTKKQKNIEAEKKAFVRKISREECEMKQLLRKLNLAKQTNNPEEFESISEYSDDAFRSDEDDEPAFVNPYPVTIVPKYQTNVRNNSPVIRADRQQKPWHRKALEYEDIDTVINCSWSSFKDFEFPNQYKNQARNRKTSLGLSLSWGGVPQVISETRRPKKSISEQVERKCPLRANTEYFAKWDADIETMVSSASRSCNAPNSQSLNGSESNEERSSVLRRLSGAKLLFSVRQGRRRAMSESSLGTELSKLPAKVSSAPRNCPCVKEMTTGHDSARSDVATGFSLVRRRTERHPLLKRHKSFIETRILKDQETTHLLPNWRRRNLSLKERPCVSISDSKRVILDASVLRSAQCKAVYRTNSCDTTQDQQRCEIGKYVPRTTPQLCPDRVQVLFPEKNDEMRPLEIEENPCAPFSPLWKRRGLKRAPSGSNPNSPGISPLAKDGYFKF
ncbi:hypothetical protein ScPMuIL_012294 [Solemya velum]